MIADYDVVVIGAGPSGSVAASLLADQAVKVLVLEKSVFPRFVIGESLLPQSMAFLEKAGLLPAIAEAGFQPKVGADFSWMNKAETIDFSDKFTPGWGSTYQVQRDRFDTILAEETAKKGVDVRYDFQVLDVDISSDLVIIKACDSKQNPCQISCRFVIDASGYGRVLPRLLGIEQPSDFPPRSSLFTHISDKFASKSFDRNKILITIHPTNPEIWYWVIPFSKDKSSIGVVVPPEILKDYSGSASSQLWALFNEVEVLQILLADAKETRPVGSITGYACNVSTLCSNKFALLGNAGEFIDPIFSSGVTVALKSADLVVAPLMKQLNGEVVDWQKDYAEPLRIGTQCFKAFVESWYEGSLQKIIFNSGDGGETIRKMIISVLAGYAWDENNPFVTQPKRYLRLVAAQCS